MKAFFTALIIASGLFSGQTAQAIEAEIPIYQYSCNQGIYNLCGYYNRATFKKGEPLDWLIVPKFEEAYAFHEDLAAVKLDGKFGFIDRDGVFKIKPTYDSVGSFYKGLAPFKEDGQVGFINKNGKVVVPPKFSRAIAINESTIIGSDNPDYKFESSKLLSSLNGVGFPTLSSFIVTGLYDLKKGWLTDQKYIFKIFDKEDTSLLWAKEGKRSAWGLIQLDGRWHKKPKFVYTQTLNSGRAVVAVKKGKEPQLWGAVDEKGDLVVPAKFEWLGAWAGEYGLAGTGDIQSRKYGLVNKKGALVGGRYFDEVQRPNYYFKATKAVYLPRVKTDGIWYSLTPEGELIADQKKAEEIKRGAILSCDNFILKRTEDGLRATDKAGQTIVDFDYPKYFWFDTGPSSLDSSLTCGFPLSISRDGKYSYLLPDGTFFAGQFFENTGPIFENVAGFSVDKKWGLIDSSGHIVVEPTYEMIRGYGDEKFLLTTGETSDLFDKDGTRYNLEDDPNYNQELKPKILPREDYLRCRDSTLKSKNGKWGMISDKGMTILPFKYQALICYEKGVAWAPRDDLKKWCPIDRHGKFLPEDSCKTTHYPRHPQHYYPKRLSDNDYDSSVLWNLQYLNYGDGSASAPPLLLPDGYRGYNARKPILMRPVYGGR